MQSSAGQAKISLCLNAKPYERVLSITLVTCSLVSHLLHPVKSVVHLIHCLVQNESVMHVIKIVEH